MSAKFPDFPIISHHFPWISGKFPMSVKFPISPAMPRLAYATLACSTASAASAVPTVPTAGRRQAPTYQHLSG